MEETNFGRYTLIEEIGQGGMGTVYRAYDNKMLREVAIKVLRPELASEAGYVQRFRREAYTAAQLNEPHVIPIYEADEIGNRLYLVMPLVDGKDLNGVLARDGAMSPERAVHIVDQIGAALDSAHLAGLVHRDVKPSNILLTDRDFAYLIDFGIAHVASATKLTSTGTTMGTWGYMAPERFTAGSADARGDIYALACVLYQCVTGLQPFPGESMAQQVHGHCYQDPPLPSAAKPELPAGLDRVIARGLAKDPDQRYQSCRDLVEAARTALLMPTGHLGGALEPGASTPALPKTTPASLYRDDLYNAETQTAQTSAPKRPEAPQKGLQPSVQPLNRGITRSGAPTSKKRNRRILIAVMAAISSVAIIVPLVSALLGLFGSQKFRNADGPVTTTSTAPVYTIKPLSVRPVVSAFVTTPDQCPPPKPVPPDQPMRICDITKTAVYELKPEALRVQLMKVDSFVNPLTGVQTVEMSMTKDSAKQFGQFTAGQVGKQIAFVRAGTVVWGPKISAPIEGEVLQLSGDLKPEQAKEISRMLKDES